MSWQRAQDHDGLLEDEVAIEVTVPIPPELVDLIEQAIADGTFERLLAHNFERALMEERER